MVESVDSKLYKEIMFDFEKDIFMQPNLIKCFNILYLEEEEMIPKSEKDKKYKTRTLIKILKR